MVVFGSLATGACDAVDDPGALEDPELLDPDARGEVGNAQVLNSAVLNGIQLNGIQLNGIQLNGIQLNGIQLNGIQLNGIQLDGSALTGTIDEGSGPEPRSGVEFIGAEFALTVGDDEFTLRFDDIHENPAQPGSGVFFHAISVREDAVGTWSSLCLDPDGAPTEAILLANTWNHTTGARIDNPGAVTFACRHAVLAKCVEWGYVPWTTATLCNNGDCNAVSLRDHHQACTRLARADYCGDGRSYTFNGTPIDVFDRLSPGLQTRTSTGQPNWSIEAEWGPNGATCVGDELRMQMYDDAGMPYTFPTCLDDLDDASDCGAMPTTRAASKLTNAYCYKWTDSPALCSNTHNDD